MATVQVTKEILENALRRNLQNEAVNTAMAEGRGVDVVQVILSDLNQAVVGTPVMFVGLLEVALRGLHATSDSVRVDVSLADVGNGQTVAVFVGDKPVGTIRYDADAATEDNGFSLNANLRLTSEAVMAIYRLGKIGPFREHPVAPPGENELVS
jgi:hypothetical protein